MPVHPADNRLTDSQPVGGDSLRVEAGTTVLHEDLGRAVGDFQVNRHGAAAVPCRVQHGLPGGLDQRLVALGHGAVAYRDHLDGVAQGVFDFRRRGLDALGELPASLPGSR